MIKMMTGEKLVGSKAPYKLAIVRNDAANAENKVILIHTNKGE
jgi:hypothetical protein